MLTKTIPGNIFELFERLDDEQGVCLLAGTRPGLLGFNPAETFSAVGADIKGLRAFVKRSARLGRPVAGYISYDAAYELHGLRRTARNDLQLPDICLHAYDNFVTFTGEKTLRLHFKDPNYPALIKSIMNRPQRSQCTYRSTNFHPVISEAQYARAYKAIRHYLYEGDLYQINFSHRLEAETDMPARELFLRTLHHNPVDFPAYFEGNNFEIISASPERFLKIDDQRIETCPIKGTRPRGRTATTDERYRRELLESTKETAELNMIIDLLRNDLGRVCQSGSVRVRGRRLVSACPTVWHTFARITGCLDKDCSALDALIRMLPGGSISGCPKKRAMEIIDELEPVTRSVYTGVIGCIQPDMRLDFSVAIRTIIKKRNRLYLPVGGGIVYDSKQKAEFRETIDKARSFMKILQ
jgi:para-aminobenzoate synthetase component 1